jgi:predicted thioesterase
VTPLTGRSAEDSRVVAADDTAVALGSGDVPVLATPRLLAWLEAATVAAVAPAIADGDTTVGVRVELDHLRSSRVGTRVTVRATVSAVEGRTIHLDVLAEDERGPIGSGRVLRAVVRRDRFLGRR